MSSVIHTGSVLNTAGHQVSAFGAKRAGVQACPVVRCLAYSVADGTSYSWKQNSKPNVTWESSSKNNAHIL